MDFIEYLLIKEAEQISVPSEIKLGKDNKFEPFEVSRDGERQNLSILIDAFNKSNEVKYGPKTLGSDGKVTKNTIKKKNLYLVGGAVRDHLDGATHSDYDLATDATMDEIRMILKHAGFVEVKPQTKVDDTDGHEVDGSKYQNLPPMSGSNKKVFFVQGTDIKGEEFVMGVKINGESFEIATFRKDSKGTSDGRTAQMEFTPNIEDDAQRRDFTVNSMYIKLDNPNGPNDKLTDFFGGIRDLAAKKVKFVGNAKDRLKEDELRALRYIRFSALYKDLDVPKEYIEAIADIKDLPSLQPHTDENGQTRDRRGRIRDEFLKGLKKASKDPRMDVKTYIQLYKRLGLLETVFPKMKFKLDVPDDYSDETDDSLATAWILRFNDPETIHKMLMDAKWSKEDARRITYLIKLLRIHPSVNAEELEKMYNEFKRSGFSSGYLPSGERIGSQSKVEKWMGMNKKDPKTTQAFLKYASTPYTQATPDHPDFSHLFDPISGKGTAEVGKKKRELEHKKWLKIWGDHQSQNNG